MMDGQFSRYSCDSCRSRKIRCTREISGCKACEADAQSCLYSRSGVIRRNRRRTSRTRGRLGRLGENQNSANSSNIATNPLSDSNISIATSEQRIRRLGGDRFSSAPLPLLFSDSTSFWQDPNFIDMFDRMKTNSSQFFTFEQESVSWIQVARNVLDQGEPLMAPIPDEILQKITLTPEDVNEKGYLLMFYGVMLTVASSDEFFPETTRMKLKWNLRLCLNDARLLLQPSELNIQALILLACHVQDFHTPSLCWIISTTAFRMFQALGTSSFGMDNEMEKRRSELFWFLNALDKSLALIFGRPPVFHQTMSEKIPMPPMQRLRSFQPHIKIQYQDKTIPEIPQSLYGAHLLHQTHLVSNIMTDIWHYTFEPHSRTSTVEVVRQRLGRWHDETVKVLEASLLIERPFLDVAGIRALELGITCVNFQFYYLTILLIKSDHHLKDECLEASRNALHSLDGLISGSVDVYNGVVWQLLYCPFTPFFVLFAHVLADSGSVSGKHALEAMEHLPLFLKQMRSRHPLAGKLFDISVALFDQARSISERDVHRATSRRLNPATSAVSPEIRVGASTRETNSNDQFDVEIMNVEFLRGFFPGRNLHYSPAARESENARIEVDETSNTPRTTHLTPTGQQFDFLADSTFDWFAWEAFDHTKADG